jgi:hypothetical protein
MQINRLRNAPAYVGMDKNRFNKEVRPTLLEMPIGKQGVAFDRLDLDRWADDYKTRNGRPAAVTFNRSKPWDKERHRASSNAVGSGISTSGLEAIDFAKQLERVTSD